VLGSAVASLFAWQVWRRRSWARVALAVCSGLTLGLSVAAPALHALLIAPGAGAVLILLFLPSADVWFRGLAAA